MVKAIQDEFTGQFDIVKRHYLRKKAQGTCVRCPEKALSGKAVCEGCRVKQNDYNRMRYANRRAV